MDSAPLTLSLWNSLTQELRKLNVATLVGMQMATDINARGDKGGHGGPQPAAPTPPAHSSQEEPPHPALPSPSADWDVFV